MGVRISNKLNAKDLAPDSMPTRALSNAKIADTDTKTIVFLGTIIGWASGLSFRANPNGDKPSVALTGAFESVPADESVDTVRSNALFLPSALHDMVVQSMLGGADAPMTEAPKRGQKIDIPAEQTKIMVEISVKRNDATGGAGYEFITSYAGEVQKIDMLEALKEEMRTGKAQALPAPKEQRAISPAKPAAKKKTTRGRK